METLKEIVDLILTDVQPLLNSDTKIDGMAVEEKVISVLPSVIRSHYEANRSLDSFYRPLYLELVPFKRKVPVGKRQFEQSNDTLLMATIPTLHGNLDYKDTRLFTIGGTALVERTSFQDLCNGARGFNIARPAYAVEDNLIILTRNWFTVSSYIMVDVIIKDPRKHPNFIYDVSEFPANSEAIEKVRYLVKRDILARNAIVQDPVVNGLDLSQNMALGKQNMETQYGEEA